MFLTSPYIDQAITPTTRRASPKATSCGVVSVMAISRQLATDPLGFRIVNTTAMNTFVKIRHNWRRLEKSTVGRRLHVQP